MEDKETFYTAPTRNITSFETIALDKRYKGLQGKLSINVGGFSSK